VTGLHQHSIGRMIACVCVGASNQQPGTETTALEELGRTDTLVDKSSPHVHVLLQHGETCRQRPTHLQHGVECVDERVGCLLGTGLGLVLLDCAGLLGLS